MDPSCKRLKTNTTVGCRVDVLDIDCDEDIDIDQMGCYVYHNGRLLEVLVPTENDASCKVRDIKEGDLIKFDVKAIRGVEERVGIVTLESENIMLGMDLKKNRTKEYKVPLFSDPEENIFYSPLGSAKAAKPRIVLGFTPLTGTKADDRKPARSSLTKKGRSSAKKSKGSPGKPQRASPKKQPSPVTKSRGYSSSKTTVLEQKIEKLYLDLGEEVGEHEQVDRD